MFLRETLLLELNPTQERLRPVNDGVDFLGYIVRRDYPLVRQRVVGHLRERLQAVLASYLGHYKLAASTGCARQCSGGSRSLRNSRCSPRQ